jgi:hypothetical protein
LDLVDRAVNILFMRILGSAYIVNRTHYVLITSHGLWVTFFESAWNSVPEIFTAICWAFVGFAKTAAGKAVLLFMDIHTVTGTPVPWNSMKFWQCRTPWLSLCAASQSAPFAVSSFLESLRQSTCLSNASRLKSIALFRFLGFDIFRIIVPRTKHSKSRL